MSRHRFVSVFCWVAWLAACANEASKPTPKGKQSPKVKVDTKRTANGPAEETAADSIARIGAVGGIPLAIPDYDKLALPKKKQVLAMVEAIAMAESVNFAMAGADVRQARRVLLGILKAKKRVPESIWMKPN